MKAKAGGKTWMVTGLLGLGVLVGATQVFTQNKIEYRVVGTMMEGCTCGVVCNCPWSGLKHGCQGVSAMVLTAGTYKGVNLAGAKFAQGGPAGDRIYIYVDAGDSQREAVTALAKAHFAGLGKVVGVRNVKIDLSGKGGRYTLTIDGGKVAQLTTEPVLGLDKKTPVTHGNIDISWNPTVMQARTVKGAFHDGDISFTLEDTNSFFNDHMESSGKM